MLSMRKSHDPPGWVIAVAEPVARMASCSSSIDFVLLVNGIGKSTISFSSCAGAGAVRAKKLAAVATKK